MKYLTKLIMFINLISCIQETFKTDRIRKGFLPRTENRMLLEVSLESIAEEDLEVADTTETSENFFDLYEDDHKSILMIYPKQNNKKKPLISQVKRLKSVNCHKIYK